ncbi:MAG: DUF2911 domain-containing protein [Opitutus sp.]|nr:DUF2911 domain-containing protein [Opitutus sp.]
MMKKLSSTALFVAAALLGAVPLFAQTADQKQPAAQQKKQPPPPPLPGAGTGGSTPHFTTSAVIGPNRREGGMVTISYGRPFATHPRKGGEPRKIWGGLVPYGKADRLGADEATLLVNEHPIEIAGTIIPSGAYTLYIVASESGPSKLAFSKHIGKWGVPVDETADLVRVDLKRDTLPESVDQLTITIENAPTGSMNGFVKIMWAKTQFSLPFVLKK